MRFSKHPITIIVVFTTTTILTVADPSSDESFLFPSDPFELSLKDSPSSTNWDLFDLDSTTPRLPYSADIFEDPTADDLLGDLNLMEPSAAGLDTLNNLAIINNDLGGSFFDASSDTLASLPADVEALITSPGQPGEAGCSEPQYPADLCCNGSVGSIIKEAGDVRIYSELRECYLSEIFVHLCCLKFLT